MPNKKDTLSLGCLSMPGKCLDGESKTRRSGRQGVAPDGRQSIFAKEGKRCASYTDSSSHYNTFKTDNPDKTDKLYFSAINLSNSFRIPSPVAFLPIFAATSSHVISSKILYRMIRCILWGIVSIHASTWSLMACAAALRYSKICSCTSRLLESLTTE